MIITFFTNQWAKTKLEEDLTLEGLAAKILSTTADSKDKLPWLKMARFGSAATDKGSLRNDANVEEVTGIELDYDAGVIGYSQGRRLLKKLRLTGLIYTSPSYTDENPRWRILLPTSAPIRPEERKRLAEKANKAFGSIFGRESKTLSQSYFYGSVNHNPHHECDIVAGGFIDQVTLPDNEEEEEPNLFEVIGDEQTKSSKPRIDVKKMLAEMVHGGTSGNAIHDTQLRCSASMLEAGWSKDEVVDAILSATKLRTIDLGIQGWNWAEEEKRIAGMCKDWIKDHPKPIISPGRYYSVGDFYRMLREVKYIYRPTKQVWGRDGIDAVVGKIKGERASRWIDRNQCVHDVTWAPGETEIIRGKFLSDGGWVDGSEETAIYNKYRPAAIDTSHGGPADLWWEHMCAIFSAEDATYMTKWLAFKVQHPNVKINHALLIGGMEGIGKDWLLAAARHAIGPWNWKDISLRDMEQAWTDYHNAVILRVNEVHDTGEISRFRVHEKMKTLIAAPPETLTVNEKYGFKYNIPNIVGVIFTTNHHSDCMVLPKNDRRTYAAWSEAKRVSYGTNYWNKRWRWLLAEGGKDYVADFLKGYNLRDFNPGAPPPKTDWFYLITNSSMHPETGDISELLGEDETLWPSAVTIKMLVKRAVLANNIPLADWMEGTKTRLQVSHRLNDCGYVLIRNENRTDGMWKVDGRACQVYARSGYSMAVRRLAANQLSTRGEANVVIFPMPPDAPDLEDEDNRR